MEFIIVLIILGLIGLFVWKSAALKPSKPAITGSPDIATITNVQSSTRMQSAVDRAFLRPPDHDKSRQRSAVRAVASESKSIAASLEPGEKLLAVAHDGGPLSTSGGVLAVTNRRSFVTKHGKVSYQVRHSEVAETDLRASPSNDVVLKIVSHASLQDYGPNDPMRYSKMIMVNVATPRIGNAICSHIDNIVRSRQLGLSRPSFGREYLAGILADAGCPITDENMFHLAQRSAAALGTQGAVYTAQIQDRAAFDDFVRRFSEPPADWLDTVDEMAEWLWDWHAGCHEALTEQAAKWAALCVESKDFLTSERVAPYQDGKNKTPADDIEVWEFMYERHNKGR